MTIVAVHVAAGLLALAVPEAMASQKSEMLYSKGLVRFHAKDLTGAEELFDQAVQADPSDARALYYRAMAKARLGNEKGAIEDLQKTIDLDPSLDQAYLELAYLQSHMQQFDVAARTLEVARTRPAIAENAEALWLSNERLRASAQPSSRRYNIGARLGMEYDSNVPLAPDNDLLRSQLFNGVSEGDGRATLDAHGAYSLYRSESLRVSARYDFEQSLHFDLDQFNIQTHRGTVDIGSNTGPVYFGLEGSYAYSSNDGHDFVLEGVALPWARILEGNWGNTDVYYRLRDQNFMPNQLETLVSGLNHAAGIRQFVYLGRPDRYLMIGYRFDQEDPDHGVSPLGYDGNQAEAGVGWAFTDRIGWRAIYAYRNENYQHPSAGREDDDHTLWIRGEFVLTPWASLVSGYRLRINDSNKKAFEYTDHIASLAVELSY